MLVDSLDDRLLRKLLIDWARQHPSMRYTEGSKIVTCDYFLLGAGLEYLKSKGANAPGIDGETKHHWQECHYDQMAAWAERVCEGLYKPRPIRGELRKKSGGGYRLIGIPTLRDRCMQTALYWVLDPLFETRFLDCSYGYRPNRSTYAAALAIEQEIETDAFRYLSKCDVEKCFDSLDYNILHAALQQRIDDPALERLIMEQAQCPIYVRGRRNGATRGIAQGGVLSPLLCNIYLHALDEMVMTALKADFDFFYIRYADDLLLLTHSAEDGRAIRARLGQFMHDELRLSLSTEAHKCFTKHVNQGITVLGWTIIRERDRTGAWNIKRRVSKDRQAKWRTRVDRILTNASLTREKRDKRLGQYIQSLRAAYRLTDTDEPMRRLLHYIRDWRGSALRGGQGSAAKPAHKRENAPTNAGVLLLRGTHASRAQGDTHHSGITHERQHRHGGSRRGEKV